MNKDKTKTKNDKKFRLSAKRLFLTYSQVPVEATKQELLQQLQSKITFADYVIGRELHQDGGAHFHAVLVADKKFDIRNANMLDVEFENKKFHGNYAATRHVNASIEYACKDGDYVTSLDNIRDGKVISIELLLAKEFFEHGRDATLRKYFSDDTKKAFGKVDLVSVDKLFAVLQRTEESKIRPVESSFKVIDFKVEGKLRKWIEADPKPTLFLVGDSGVGKSQFVLALAKELGWLMEIINQVEGIRRISPQHNAIFFDDFSFGKIDEEQLLALVDTEFRKDLRVLYGAVSKLPGLVQVFAMNHEALAKIEPSISQPRFLRRIEIVHIPNDFMPNVQINIQINNTLNLNVNQVADSASQVQSTPTRTQIEQARIKSNLETLHNLRLAPAQGTDLSL
jgi:hypothetical protein